MASACHCTQPLVEMGSCGLFFGLILNYDPPDLHLLSNLDYRLENPYMALLHLLNMWNYFFATLKSSLVSIHKNKIVQNRLRGYHVMLQYVYTLCDV
jgi:hypothetical protein